MSLAKKITFLLLALVLLMIVCISMHINDFKIENEKSILLETTSVPKLEPKVEETPNIKIEQQEKTPLIPIVKDTIETKKETPIRKKIVKEIIPSLEKKTKLKKTKTNNEIQKEIDATLKVQRIIFKRLSTQVTNNSYITIKKIAEILTKNPDTKIEVGGHTDARGADDVNEYISLTRAKSVRNDLIKLGINKERISAKGYGKTKPIVKNDPQGYSTINRRVEFKIIEE